jgi:hypothetical protein
MKLEIFWDDLTPRAQENLLILKPINLDEPMLVVEIETIANEEVKDIDHSHIWRILDNKEEAIYRKWARSNFNPAEDAINNLWHPVVKDECLKMIKEHNV